MWKLSNVFSILPFLVTWMIFILSAIFPIACPFSRRCWANLDLLLLYLKSLMCSWNLILNGLPVCPVYIILQSGQVKFKIQTRIIRIIMNSNKNASCRELFKKLNILPLQSQYIYSILLFIIKNKNQFPLNLHMHTINTRHNNNLHVPLANLTVYQRGVYYSGIKIFNHLPTTIKNLSDNKKKFQIALRKFLL